MSAFDGFELISAHIGSGPSCVSNLNAPFSNAIESRCSQPRSQITVIALDSDGKEQGQRNRHTCPTYVFNIGQKPFILSDPFQAATVSPTSPAVGPNLRAFKSGDSEAVDAPIDLTDDQNTRQVMLPPAAPVDFSNSFTHDHSIHPAQCLAYGLSKQTGKTSVDVMFQKSDWLVGEKATHGCLSGVSTDVGCIATSGSSTADFGVSFSDQGMTSNSFGGVDLFCHEKFEVNDELFQLLENDIPSSTCNYQPLIRDINKDTGQRGNRDREVTVQEENTKTSRAAWRKLRQSKVVAKWWWHLSTEHWRGRSEGGVYVNGELTNAKKSTTKPAQSDDDSVIEGDKRTEKIDIDDRRKPSRFCHICLRRAERVTAVACHNLSTGRCRKVICKRCFDEYNWPWTEATTKNSQWICPHCRKEFVPFIFHFPISLKLIPNYF